jgi:hypothetical protein
MTQTENAPIHPTIRKTARVALPLGIMLYGFLYACAAVALNIVLLEWSWIILLIIYLPFIVLYYCDTSYRERTNLYGRTVKRTGWPFRVAFVSACIPPPALFCFLVGACTTSFLHLSPESGRLISIGIFIAFVLYAIHTYRWVHARTDGSMAVH